MSMPPPENPYHSPQESQPVMMPDYGPTKTSGLAIASLVLGITSYVPGCCCVLIGAPLAIGAAVCGFIALGQINAGRVSGKGMAIAGIVLGLSLLALHIGAIVFQLLSGGAMRFQQFQGPGGF